jgi:predicted regulator of Ras-like GTPase activity (Roadblock/LC7/MglB family)
MFNEVVKGVLGEVEGAQCVILTGHDGVVVAAAAARGGPVPEVVAASLSDLFRRVAQAHRDAGLALPTEFTCTGPDGHAALREVTPQYLLLAVLDGSGSLGQARFALLKAAETLETEL